MHPSWRDLVIEELVRDADERRRFLAHSGVDGAALALSSSGGADGERRQPLLADDADWDALGDGLHRLCAELDDSGATRLLTVLREARGGHEHDALVGLVLERLRRRWDGQPVDVDALEAWFALAGAGVEPLSLGATWVELEPLEAPETPAELERFADWLRLAELLIRRDPELLERLGFPARHRDLLDRFDEQVVPGEPPMERELRADTRRRLARLDPFRHGAAVPAAVELEPGDWLPPDELPVASGFSIERVLRDLE